MKKIYINNYFLLLLLLFTPKFIGAQTAYTLTDDDVVMVKGVLVSCSYIFDNKSIIIPSILDGQTVTEIGSAEYYNSGVFEGKRITKVVLPNTLQYIGDRLFKDNDITELKIPSSVLTIGYEAFEGNGVSTVTFEEGSRLEFINDGAFENNLITNFYISSSIIEIGENAFRNNILSTIIFDDNCVLENIEKGTFYGNNIDNLIIPLSIKNIYDNAFYGNNIESLIIPSSVKSIYNNAFDSNNIVSLTFEADSQLSYIGEGAFKGNVISSFILPVSNNFTHWWGESNSLKDYIKWWSEADTKISAGSEVTDFESIYFADLFYTLTDDDVDVVNGIIVSCSYDFSMKMIDIPETLDGQTVIGISGDSDRTQMFNTKGLFRVKLPNTLEFIDPGSFRYNNITDLEIPSNVTHLSGFMYNNITHLEIPSNVTHLTGFSYNNIDSLIIPSNVTYLGDFGHNGMKSLIFENDSSLDSIEKQSFENNNISTLTIPNSVTVIGGYAFSSGGISKLRFEEGSNLIEIGESGFSSNNIDSLIIPNSVTDMEKNAFRNNELKSVKFESESNLTIIDRYVFYENKLDSLLLPEHSEGQGGEWYDEDMNRSEYITDFKKLYSLSIVYTLINEDVVVDNGFIKECSYDFLKKNIIIPDIIDGQTIVGISDKVFKGKDIIRVKLPSNLQYIGVESFNGNFINDIDFPNSLLYIGDGAFTTTVGVLTNTINRITIPKSVKYIGDFAFIHLGIDSLVFEDNSEIEFIGEDTFSYNNLIELNIPASLKSIGASAFRTNNLDTIIIPDNSLLTYIGESAFSKNSFESFMLPSSSSVTFDSWVDGKGHKYSQGDSITDIDNSYAAFIEYTLTDDDVVVSNGVIVSCNYDFSSKFIIIPNDLDGQTIIGIANDVFSNKLIQSIKLPEYLENIGESAFKGNKLNTLKIPSNVERIYDKAFYNNSIKSIDIEDDSHLISVGYYAFAFNSIETVSLPNLKIDGFLGWIDGYGNSLPTGGAVSCFTTTYDAIIPYTLTDDDVVVVNGEIKSCSYNFQSKFIIIPELLDTQSVIGVGKQVFYDKGIKDVTFPETLKSIKNGAFASNDLDFVKIPIGLEFIYDSAFLNGGIDSLFIPENCQLRVIGQDAFSQNNIRTLKIPRGVEQINNTAFTRNYQLEKVTISNTVSYIGQSAFFYCSIKNLLFEDESQLTSIESDVFSNNLLTNIEIPSSVIDISSYAFKDNRLNVIEFEDDSKLITLEDDAFGYSEKMSYKAIKSKISNIIIPKGVIVLENCFSECIIDTLSFEEDSQLEILNLHHDSSLTLSSLIIPPNVTEILDSSLKDLELKQVRFDPGSKLISIGKQAFSGNNIEEIIIPKSVESIGERAFVAINLKKLSFEEGSKLNEIGDYSFYKNFITNLVLPESVKSIGNYAFEHNQIQNLEIKKGSILETIGEYAFSGEQRAYDYNDIDEGENAIENLFIPNTVIHIGDKAFYYNNIKNLIFEDDSQLEEINEYVFSNNIIENLELPKKLISIGVGAFAENLINYLFIPNKVDSIDIAAFSFNVQLDSIVFEDKSELTYLGSGAFEGSKIDSLLLPTATVYNAGGWTDGYGTYYGEDDKILYKRNGRFSYTAIPDEGSDSSSGKDESVNSTVKEVIQAEILANSTSFIESLKIYPNPVATYLNIELNNNDGYIIQIYDLLGKLYFQKESSSSIEVLDISNLNSGMYLLRIQTNDKSITRKIIKK